MVTKTEKIETIRSQAGFHSDQNHTVTELTLFKKRNIGKSSSEIQSKLFDSDGFCFQRIGFASQSR